MLMGLATMILVRWVARPFQGWGTDCGGPPYIRFLRFSSADSANQQIPNGAYHA